MRDPERKAAYAPAQKIGVRVMQEARTRGVMIRPLGNIVILMPPLSITDSELSSLLDVVRDAIRIVT